MKNRDRAGRVLILTMGCLLVASIGTLFWVGQIALTSTASLSAHRTIIEHLRAALSTLTDAETVQRGYLLTGEDRYMEPYNGALARVRAQQETLRRLAASGDLPPAGVRSVLRLTDQNLAELDRAIRVRREEGLSAAFIASMGGGQRLMDEIRATVEGLATAEEGDYQEAFRRARWAARIRILTAIAVGLLNLGFLGWAYGRLRAEMKQREAAVIQTEQQKEKALKAKEDWERTFDAVPDLISILDKEHRILRANRALARRLGKTPEEIVGLRCFACVHGLKQPPAGCPHTLTCRDGQPHTAEIRDERWGSDFLITTTPLRNPQGEMLGSVHVARDITELKRAGQALKQSEQVLRESEERRQAEQRIRELNQQLEQRVSELAAANQELEAFSYSVSHDLRAPLRQIAGFAGLLRESAAGTLDPASAEYLPLIENAVRRMSQLIDDLLAFSRAGRGELERSEVDLNALVDQVRQTLESATQGRLVEWKIHSLPTVRGDTAMLRQVLANLLENALKFTRNCPRTIIEVGCDSFPAEHQFFVQDNGVGFDSRYKDNLFGLFQRLHRVAEFEGTGIGLASVRRIILRHGGRTWAESVLGQGATFYFSLPVVGQESCT
jgi:PAS domain S-box-containing protein